MIPSRSFAKAVTGVGIATLACKALAAFQQLLLARTLGATEMADAFFLAQIVPVLLSGLLYNALSTNVVVLLATLPLETDKGAFLTGLLVEVVAAMALLTVIVLGVSRFFVQTASNEQERALIHAATSLQAALLPVLVLQPVSGVLAGALQSAGRLAAPPISMILPYAAGIAALALTTDSNPYPLAIGLVAGCIAQFTVLAAFLHRTGTRFARPFFGYGRLFLRLTLPCLGCNAVSTLYLVSDRAFAATLGLGQVAVISYIYSIITMPTQILVNTVVGVSLPRWVRLRGSRDEFVKALSSPFALLCLLVVPVSLTVGLASGPITDVLLGSTKFSTADSAHIATSLGAFSLAILGFAVKDTLTAALISQGNSGFALLAGLGGVIIASLTRSFYQPSLDLNSAAYGTTAGLLACVVALLWNIARGGFIVHLWKRTRVALIPIAPAAAASIVFTTPESRTVAALAVYGLGVGALARYLHSVTASNTLLEG